MKTFYNRSLNWINYLLGCLLGLLGFSCDGIGETPDEYGTPWATYQFRGRVLDASNQPIGNLRVKAIPANDDMALYARDTTRTDAEGAFLIETAGFPTSSFELIIEDTDGEANGGQFNNMSTLIQIDDSEYQEGDGRWYEGKVTREMDIHLEKQE